MAIITTQEAETQLLHWLPYVALGEEVLITKEGQTIAKLVPVPTPPSKPRVLGIDAGKPFWISEDFDDSLPETILGGVRSEQTTLSN